MDLFYHSYPQEYNVHPYLYIDARATKVFQNALTLHHLKLSYVMYDVHSYFTAKLRKEWWDASLALRITSQKLSDAHLKNSPITLSVAELPSLMPLETVEPLTSAATLTATDSSQAPLEFESSDWIYSDPSASVDLSSRGVLGPSESKALLGRITDITRRAITQEKMRFEKVVSTHLYNEECNGLVDLRIFTDLLASWRTGFLSMPAGRVDLGCMYIMAYYCHNEYVQCNHPQVAP